MKFAKVNETMPNAGEIRDTIPRQDCAISEEEFVKNFVRPMKPVILTGCKGYEWLDKYDLSLPSVTWVRKK